MGLINETVDTNWNSANKQWLIDKGYIFTKIRDKIIVKVEDLSDGSHSLVNIKCDDCNIDLIMAWRAYKKIVREDGKCYCKKCANEYRIEQSLKTRRENSKSIAQYLIDKYGTDAVEKYLDCKKNKECGLDPYVMTNGSNTKIWVNCINTNYHESYFITPYEIKRGRDCPYCAGRKVHPLDSLGEVLEDRNLLWIWSEKNDKSVYEYRPRSNQKAWFKCPDKIHEDSYRTIGNAIVDEFRCPECQYSKGEKRINDYFIKNNISCIPQKPFDGLYGINGGLLSYDFYLSQNNLLIEYQGEYHDDTVSNQSEEQFLKQQIHDHRKKQYAIDNGIELLEIWYYDYDNIEQILNNYFQQLNNNLKPLKEAI